MNESPLTLAAKNIRAELHQHYPNVAFSVRSRRYSGGDSISVVWTAGPTANDIAVLTEKYQQGHFDGMIDSYVRDEDPQRQEFRRLRGSTKYVILQRRRAVQ